MQETEGFSILFEIKFLHLRASEDWSRISSKKPESLFPFARQSDFMPLLANCRQTRPVGARLQTAFYYSDGLLEPRTYQLCDVEEFRDL